MQSLQLRTYTRAELEEIFHTTRTDTIKRSLQRAGYTFESGGRGKEFTITITGLPEPPTPFEAFAKREFACGPQILSSAGCTDGALLSVIRTAQHRSFDTSAAGAFGSGGSAQPAF